MQTEQQIQIMLFSAKWCGHCKNFNSEWKNFIKMCDTKFNNVKLVPISYDSEIHQKECDYYKIQGFPTILINFNGKIGIYNGERNAEQLLKSIKETHLRLMINN